MRRNRCLASLPPVVEMPAATAIVLRGARLVEFANRGDMNAAVSGAPNVATIGVALG